MDHKVDRAIVRAFFHISFLVDGHENSSAPVLGPLFAPPYLITQLPQQGYPPLLLKTSIAQLVNPGSENYQ